MQRNIAELSSQFSVPGLHFETGHGGLVKAVVNTPLSIGEIYLHGAHVTKFVPQGRKSLLWMSEKSVFEADKPIRGGVPICFPWFGPLASDPKAPGHGFARTRPWNALSASTLPSGAIALELQTTIHDFAVKFLVTFAESLHMALNVELKKSATAALSFEEALHTYLTISDIREISIEGLESIGFIDKVNGATQKPAAGQPLRIDGECDRVYLDTTQTCLLRDPGFKRTIRVSKTASHSTVVWNPWIEKSARMADFGDHEWPGMVCIETANVASNSIELHPGQSHVMTAEISSHPLT